MTFAAVFPGQGSQSTAMLAALAAEFGEVQQTFAEASAVLGFDLWTLVQDNPEQALDKTVNTQPAMLAAGVASWRVWCAAGGSQPAVLAGHSLGEYTALVAAGAIGFADAVRLVAARACYMQQAVPEGEGAMAAILGLSDADVLAVCGATATGVVEAVNFNAPGQVVIAGQREAVEQAAAAAKDAGARRAMLLPVSVPSHSSLMREAAQQLAATLVTVSVQRPEIPVIHNVDGQACDSVEAIRAALVRQLYSPVHWVAAVTEMNRRIDSALFVEMGPGKVLSGLVKRIVKPATVVCIDTPESLGKALEMQS